MRLDIFDVEHGACALLTCDDNTRMMIDCGHNSSTGWKPGTYLRSIGVTHLEMLTITNYDEDHVSGINNLFDNVTVSWITRNPTVGVANIAQLKSDTGMGPGIAKVCDLLPGYITPPSVSLPLPSFTGLTWTLNYNSYPDFEDENNLSVALHLKCGAVGVMFMGDLEEEGIVSLLRFESFRNALRDTRVMVAPHHGRDSGVCYDLLEHCSLNYVVISDKGYEHETQYTLDFYRRLADQGGPFRGQTERRVLTTRSDGTISFEFTPQGWHAF